MMKPSVADNYYHSINKMVGASIKMVHWAYSLVYKNAGQTASTEVDRVVNIDYTKDYIKGFTDNIVVTVRLYKEDYINKLYPIRNALLIDLIQTQLPETESGSRLESPKIMKRTFRGILVNPEDVSNSAAHSGDIKSTEDKQNQDKQFYECKIQLFDLNAELMRGMNFGQIAEDATPEDLCRSMISKAIDVMGKAASSPVNKLSGVNLSYYDKDSQKIPYIIIPHGTPLLKLPFYLQENYPVFKNFPIGSYIYEKYWYIYPIFDCNNDNGAQLILSVVPKGQIKQPERTYYVNGNKVSIMCTGEVNTKDNSLTQAMNEGDGVTYFDTRKVKSESVVKKDDGIYINAKGAKKQSDAAMYSTYLEGRIDSTPYKTAEKQAMAKGQLLSLKWEFSNPDLLVPGMHVEVVYFKDDKQYNLKGMLVGQTSNTQPVANMSIPRYQSTTVIHVYTELPTLHSRDKRNTGATSSKMNSFASLLGL